MLQGPRHNMEPTVLIAQDSTRRVTMTLYTPVLVA